ncbi:TPA: branched-chain amino acid ABC transporter permease, partial [Vibrio cholerae]
PVLISVLTALVLSVLLTVMGIEGSLMFASIGAMLAGYGTERLLGARP